MDVGPDSRAGLQEGLPDILAPPAYFVKPQQRRLHDPAVTFEEYHYYALRTREEEAGHPAPKTNWREILLRKKPAHQQQNADSTGVEKVGGDSTEPLSAVHTSELNYTNRQNRMEITDREWTDASRAFRTASWGACFYLITTDILGPYGVGFAMGTLGWGPGIALYTVFGFLAGYSGWLLWKGFMGLDSHEFPLKNYGDLTFRIFGTIPRHIVNVLQALALLLILGQVTIVNGQALSQVSKFRLCYAVCPVLFVAAGFLLGQIRTLRAYGWVANLAIWLNLLVIFISMGVMSDTPPNYQISVLGSAGAAVNPASITPDANGNYPPVMHYNNLPPNGLVGSINGILSGVFAYGGAQLFIEFMAEMKRPNDFIKAMWGAQLFIWIVYLAYGCFVYYYQGQYSFSISYQGLSVYAWQVVGDMIALISGLIAAGLYGNIGIKVLYNNVFMDLFNAPPLITRRGRYLWVVIVPIWWSIAYVISAAIPYYIGFVSIVAALTLLQFAYTFPPMLALGYDIHMQALRADPANGFDPVSGRVTRHRTGVMRYVYAFFGGGVWQTAINIWHVIYALGSWVMAGLGMYAAIEGFIIAFNTPQFNAFSCTSPLDLAPS